MMWFAHVGVFGWLVMLACMAVVVIVVVVVGWAVIRPANRAPAPPSDAALDILRQRFARGEISAADFESAKRTLGL